MELEGLLLLADVANISRQSLFDTNSDHKDEEEDAHKFKFRDLFMLADVASSIATTASHYYNTAKKKKKQNLPKPKSSVPNSWSLQVLGNSNLKLRFNKIKNTTFISSSSNSTRSSSNPIHLLSQVAFAYKTSTLWALCPNSIPTKTRSTYNRRRPNKGLPHLLTTTFAGGNKRRFAEIKSSRIQNSNKRRKVAQSLPIQLSNYLATKKAVSEPTSDDESTITSFQYDV